MDENLVLKILDTDSIANQVRTDLEWAARRYRLRNPNHLKEKEYTVQTEIIWVPAEWHGPLPQLTRSIITRSLVKLTQTLAASDGIECESFDWRDTAHEGFVRQLPWMVFSKTHKVSITKFVWSKPSDPVPEAPKVSDASPPPPAQPSVQVARDSPPEVSKQKTPSPERPRREPVERVIEKDGRVLVLTSSGERVDRYVPKYNGGRRRSPSPRRRSPPRHRGRSRSRSPARRWRSPPRRDKYRSPPRRNPSPPRRRSRTPPRKRSPSPELPRRLREPKSPSPSRTPPPPRRPEQQQQQPDPVVTNDPPSSPQQPASQLVQVDLNAEDDDLAALGIEPGDYELLIAAN